MGALTEAGLDELVQAGCPSCHGHRLTFRSYLDGRLPILGGEPVGKLAWCYDGEKFVDGVYEVTCADCQAALFAATLCPRCHADGGLALALGSEDSYQRLAACPACDGEELRYIALVPGVAIHEGKRIAAPTTQLDCYDPGFHGFRVDCASCGPVAELVDHCPLCAAPGPLRPRP